MYIEHLTSDREKENRVKQGVMVEKSPHWTTFRFDLFSLIALTQDSLELLHVQLQD
jgi:hypothetical protein